MSDQRVEISFGLFGAIVVTCDLALAVARNPERAGGSRAGAANLIGFFAQQDVETFQRGDERGCHPGWAGARD